MTSDAHLRMKVSVVEGEVWKQCGAVDLVAGYRSAQLEADSTRRAAALFSDSKRFGVPNVLAVDGEQDRFSLEYISGLVPLASLMFGTTAEFATDLMERVGEVLALAHQGLEVPGALRAYMPFAQGVTHSEGPIHGDFTPENVLLQPLTQRVFVLDWSAAPALGQEANWGDQYWDLAWMAWTITSRSEIIGDSKRVKILLASLVGAYADHLAGPFSIAGYHANLRRVFTVRRKRVKGRAVWQAYSYAQMRKLTRHSQTFGPNVGVCGRASPTE